MTSDDKPKTEHDQEIEDMRDRLWATRQQLFRAQDEAHQLRRQLNKATTLRGPTWTDRAESSDGRVWARPLADCREGWIRCFAGQALAGAAVGEKSINAPALVDAAYAMWDELEQRLRPERDRREMMRQAEVKTDDRQRKLWNPTLDQRVNRPEP